MGFGAILKAITGIIDLVSTIMTMIREKELRDQGFKEALRQVRKNKAKAKEIVDEIDNKRTPDKPDDILDRM